MPLDFFYTMVPTSQKWPKTQIKGSCLKFFMLESSLKNVKIASLFCAWPVIPLEVFSKVRISRTNEITFISYFIPSPRPQTKVWSTMWENVLQTALNANCPHSSLHPARTTSSVSRRDTSKEVQHPLQNEQEDNLEQLNNNFFLNKNTIFFGKRRTKTNQYITAFLCSF